MANETTITITVTLNTEDLRVADMLVKKLMNSLELEELELIDTIKTTKLLSEMEVSSSVFDENNKG